MEMSCLAKNVKGCGGEEEEGGIEQNEDKDEREKLSL